MQPLVSTDPSVTADTRQARSDQHPNKPRTRIAASTECFSDGLQVRAALQEVLECVHERDLHPSDVGTKGNLRPLLGCLQPITRLLIRMLICPRLHRGPRALAIL